VFWNDRYTKESWGRRESPTITWVKKRMRTLKRPR